MTQKHPHQPITLFLLQFFAFHQFLSNHTGLKSVTTHGPRENTFGFVLVLLKIQNQMHRTLFSLPRSHLRQGSNLDKYTTLKVSDQIWSTVVPSLPSFLSLSETTVTLPLPGRQSNWNIPFVSSIYRLQRAQHHLSMNLHNGRIQNRKDLPTKNFLI